MDWRNYLVFVFRLIIVPFAYGSTTANISTNGISPYFDLVLCPIRTEPWACARSQSARILDVWDMELHKQWQKFKGDADQQMQKTFEKRGFSASDVVIKEKPSSILKKIEIGTNYMKEYLSETLDGFLGREYENMQSEEDENEPGNETNNKNDEEFDDDVDEDGTGGDDDSDDDDDSVADNELDDNENYAENSGEDKNMNIHSETDFTASEHTEEQLVGDNTKNVVDNAWVDDEFIEISGGTSNEQLKRPSSIGGAKKQKKRKMKKKKGQHNAEPATLVVVQPIENESISHPISTIHADEHTTFQDHNGHHKPSKQKRKKRKKKHQHGGQSSTVVVEEETDDHLGLGLLEELINTGDLLSSSGGNRKKKGHSSNYGRSNGVTRGKKKKKKKALMKLVLLGTFLKAKIELLLKILGAHLQIKFFAIALIGLLINIARFWIDVKRGGAPQKVIYVEHAHHQHHYEDHGDDWNEQSGYWKRSLQTESTLDENSSIKSYQLRPQDDAQYLAYRNHW